MVLFSFFGEAINGQCLTVNTIPNFNCVTSVCEITITVNNGSAPPPYTITSSPAGISGIMTGNTFTLTNIPFQPSYNVFIAGSGTCTGFGQVLYSNLNSPINISVTQTNVSCFGGNNGAATSVFTGGAPYTWLWSNGSTNSAVSGLPEGTYSVTMTNSAGCTATRPFTITGSPEISSALSTTFIPCFGGIISSAITTTGGATPYSYTLNGNPLGSSGNIVTSVSAGLYTIVTKDSKGCLKTNTVQINQATQQTITATIVPPNCPGESTGLIGVSVSGPVSGYSYSWNPALLSVPSPTLGNLPAGNYTIYVLDASSCVTKSVFTVPQAPAIIPISIVKKENCSAVDGAFTLNVSGGHPPFTYITLPVISNGTVVSGLSTNNYTTVITDAFGCKDTTITYVGNLSTVSLNILTVTAVECYNTCNGSVILNVQNAVPPLTYSLTGMPVFTNNVVSNLCAGFYLVKAIDNIGCPALDTVNFIQPPIFTYSANAPPTICIGKNALLKGTAAGGSGAHTYIWNPGSLNGPTVSVEPVVTTTYSLNVYDAKGCTLPPFKVVVNVNPKISININSSDAGICPGTTAQITPTVGGGDGNYTYLWLPGNEKGSSIFVENVTVPTYTLRVKDACGSPEAIKEIEIKLHPIVIPEYKTDSKGGCIPFCAKFINMTPFSSNAIWNYGDKPIEKLGDTTYYCYENPGNFNLRLTVTDSNSCKTSFTFKNAVKVLARPGAGFITEPGIITLNEAENVLIKNTTVNPSFYKWFMNGEYLGTKQNINLTFKDTGCFDIKLIAENENRCIDSTIRSICVFEGFNFYMPGAFSPNKDGLNDVLLPKGTGWLYDGYLFEIYNRWGHKVFSTKDVFQGWDGGVITDPYVQEVIKADLNNVYIWRVLVTDNLLKEHELKGSVTLVR